MASGPDRLGEWRQNWLERLSVPDNLLRDTVFGFSLLLAATALAAFCLSLRPELDWEFVLFSVSGAALIFGLCLGALCDHPFDRFGYANLVTAFRACLVSLIGAALFCFEGLAQDKAVLLVMIAIVFLTLALDGVDGYLARRFDQESAFGARFDMEVDALMILVLSSAAALLDKAGPWVMLIGLMRYAFVIAGWIDLRLEGELFPSFRRKLICVVQISALCLLLAPFVMPPVSTMIAFGALALLTYSFAVDIRYLLRKPLATR
jgi:phosphatidylglycerophosphate synthase